MEFAQLAILAAAAGAGDREAQADILFMLIDKDQNQTIEHHELARFCRNAERWGLLLDGDPQRTCEEVWSDASGYGNGMMTQAQFRKVASRFRPVDLPAPVAGAEWRELVEKHKTHTTSGRRRIAAITTLATCVPAAAATAAAMAAAVAAAAVLGGGTRWSCATARPGPSSGSSSARRSPGIASPVATLRFDASAAAPLFEVRGVPRDGRPRVCCWTAASSGRGTRPAPRARRPRRTASSTIWITTDHRIRIVADGGAELECADSS